MPNNADFSKLDNVKETSINPSGWINPLIIEYGISNDVMPLCCWRIKGTKHTFTIPVIRLDYISEGNYKTHFSKALETFREDYIKWASDGFFTEWAKEYENQYSKYINL